MAPPVLMMVVKSCVYFPVAFWCIPVVIQGVREDLVVIMALELVLSVRLRNKWN